MSENKWALPSGAKEQIGQKMAQIGPKRHSRAPTYFFAHSIEISFCVQIGA